MSQKRKIIFVIVSLYGGGAEKSLINLLHEFDYEKYEVDLLLLDLGSDGLTGKEVEQLLDRANITVNKNSVPNETRKPTVTSGIRVGTPAATTRGLNEDDFVLVGRLIADIIKNGEEAVERVAAKVREITDKYPLYPGE